MLPFFTFSSPFDLGIETRTPAALNLHAFVDLFPGASSEFRSGSPDHPMACFILKAHAE